MGEDLLVHTRMGKVNLRPVRRRLIVPVVGAVGEVVSEELKVDLLVSQHIQKVEGQPVPLVLNPNLARVHVLLHGLCGARIVTRII